ncbi:MAG TPA: hypothetical protein VLD58_08840 [Gemmatimonadales bacterium]|jgi:hypothetical protein|nr:hypothetical protein [Gemmatimonadales bacterium]
MDDVPHPPLTTREFAVRWHTLVEEHSVQRLTGSLSRLAPVPPGSASLAPQQYTMMAGCILHALQVAASPSGGVEEAVRYLVQLGTEGATAATRD